MRRGLVQLAFVSVMSLISFFTLSAAVPEPDAAADGGDASVAASVETASRPGGDPGPAGDLDEELPATPPELLEDALTGVPKDEERMQAYSHGNYVLFLVGALWSIGLLLAIVMSGFSGRLQRLVERWTSRPNLKVAGYTVLYTLVVFACTLPLSLYSGFFREREYGFANQTLSEWFGDWGKGLAVSIVMQSIFFVILFGAIRRLDRKWWIAGTAIGIAFIILIVAVAPVFIAPLFNTFEPLEDRALRDEILAMAHDQGIPAKEVFEMDASRQSEHNNAYVTGLLGTQRIVLYDTTLEKFAPREIKFIMGHEMGHYVLNHIWKTIAYLAILILAGFLIVDRVARRVIERRPSFGIRALAEPASLPLILLVFNVFILFTSPIVNSISRTHEQQADRFGLEVTGDPVAAASSFIRFGKEDLGEYHVHPAIEALLYSHPSLGSRIQYAQEYAAAHEGETIDGAP